MPLLPDTVEAPSQTADPFTRNKSHVSNASVGAHRPRAPRKRRNSLIDDMLEHDATGAEQAALASVPAEPEKIHAGRKEGLGKRRAKQEDTRNPHLDAELEIDPVADAAAGDDDLKADVLFEEDSEDEDEDGKKEETGNTDKQQAPGEYVAVLSTWGLVDRSFLILVLVVLTARAIAYHDPTSTQWSNNLRESLLISPSHPDDCLFPPCTENNTRKFFVDIRSREHFWGWIEHSLLPMLYHGSPDDKGQALTFGDQTILLARPIVLTQVRTARRYCPQPAPFVPALPDCLPEHTSSSEERSELPGEDVEADIERNASALVSATRSVCFPSRSNASAWQAWTLPPPPPNQSAWDVPVQDGECMLDLDAPPAPCSLVSTANGTQLSCMACETFELRSDEPRCRNCSDSELVNRSSGATLNASKASAADVVNASNTSACGDCTLAVTACSNCSADLTAGEAACMRAVLDVAAHRRLRASRTWTRAGDRQPFSPLPMGKGELLEGGYRVEIAGEVGGARWLLERLQGGEWVDAATHSLHVELAGRVAGSERVVFAAMSASRSRFDTWSAGGWVWTANAASEAGDLSAWDDGLLVFCGVRLFLSLRALYVGHGGINVAAFTLETLSFIVLVTTFILQDRGHRQLKAILAAENATATTCSSAAPEAQQGACPFGGGAPAYGLLGHIVMQWQITLGVSCLLVWAAVSWRLTRPARSTSALVACAGLLAVPAAGLAVASRVWSSASLWERMVTLCQALVRDSSFVAVHPVEGAHDTWVAAAHVAGRYVGSAALIAVATSVFLSEGLHKLTARYWLERFVNDVPPKSEEEKQQEQAAAHQEEVNAAGGSARKLPTARQRSMLLQLVRPVHSIPRKQRRLLHANDKFKGLNIPDPAKVQRELDRIVGEDVQDDAKREKLIKAMDHKMQDVLRSLKRLDGEVVADHDAPRHDTAGSSRPRTTAAVRATRKIEQGLLWVLEHGNWFST